MSEIENIVIVGGGTAGWLSAAFLERNLNRGKSRPIKITLIESPAVDTIGVGEATVPTLRGTLNTIDVREAEFMRAADATFKNGIRFRNWIRNPVPDSDDFYDHPFASPLTISGHGMLPVWLARRNAGGPESFAVACTVQSLLFDRGLSPKRPDAPDYGGELNYAYHLDAGKFGQFLRTLATGRGVVHISDTVTGVNRADNGFISSVETENNGRISGDLFIDCSGFRGLLINQALEEPFVSYGDQLFCDRAVAIRTAFPAERPTINCYTTSTALDAGWIWDIHLSRRRGSGYVYSSAFISDDEAEAELRRVVGPNSEGIEARRLKMRVGRNRNSWVGNCIAIGLSSGFIEPLESTGIYFVEAAARLLFDAFPTKAMEPVLRDNFNQLMNRVYDETRDFIVLHYCLSERDDTPFWKANSNHPAIPETLAARLELWDRKIPSANDDFGGFRLFSHFNWAYVLIGMQRYPDLAMRIAEDLNGKAIAKLFERLHADQARAMETLPDHTRTIHLLHDQDTAAE